MIRNKKQDYVLAYKQPASTTYMGWEEEALPIGNGSLGAKVFGLIGAERIQFNEKSLWSGGPLPDSSDYQGGNLQDQYVFFFRFGRLWRREITIWLRNWLSST